MINVVDRALERYLREQVPLRESTIGVSFDPPDRDWCAGLNRPTVNVFLWDVSRAAKTAYSGIDERRTDQGTERRPVNPGVELHYLLTAWASAVSDEHQVLGSVLAAVLRRGVIPRDTLPEGVVDGPCRIALDTPEHRVPGEFWSALGGRLKPGLQLKVTLRLPVREWIPAPPAPTSLELGVDRVAPIATVPTPAARWVPADGTSPRRVRRNGVVTAEGRQAAKPAGVGDDQPG